MMYYILTNSTTLSFSPAALKLFIFPYSRLSPILLFTSRRMDYHGSVINDIDFDCVDENISSRSSLGKGRYKKGKVLEFKSKNLEAERRRRHKLNDRLIALRASVPIITNLNKATIIDDAITYITGLKKHVDGLTNQLLEMEAPPPPQSEDVVEKMVAQEADKLEIKAEVKVSLMDESKLWIEIVCENKRGQFVKVTEAIGSLCFEIINMNVTTSKGVTLITFCVKVNGEMVLVEQVKGFLEQMMGN
ncbi:hypothetical protein GIB67_032570 [Kingdonia uniflora]|uniref:BHLH domain-containing protein n=1 Tax=Kingdonia uniflora TaxID=39325 RepID=A0A7J7LS77_9MAGN|nr:hypothetical protein GIB67_032570 [Kingdonia uniflora]